MSNLNWGKNDLFASSGRDSAKNEELIAVAAKNYARFLAQERSVPVTQNSRDAACVANLRTGIALLHFNPTVAELA